MNNHLSPEEQATLTALNDPQCKVFGKARIHQVLAIVGRLLVKLTDTERESLGNQLMAQAMWGAATGEISEEDIANFPRFADHHRADLLKVVQMRYDALAWRSESGIETNPIPQRTPSPAESNAALHLSERVG